MFHITWSGDVPVSNRVMGKPLGLVMCKPVEGNGQTTWSGDVPATKMPSWIVGNYRLLLYTKATRASMNFEALCRSWLCLHIQRLPPMMIPNKDPHYRYPTGNAMFQRFGSGVLRSAINTSLPNIQGSISAWCLSCNCVSFMYRFFRTLDFQVGHFKLWHSKFHCITTSLFEINEYWTFASECASLPLSL